MKRLVFGISLMILGAILIGASLIAGSIDNAGTGNVFVFDNAVLTIALMIGAMTSIAGLVISIAEVNKK